MQMLKSTRLLSTQRFMKRTHKYVHLHLQLFIIRLYFLFVFFIRHIHPIRWSYHLIPWSHHLMTSAHYPPFSNWNINYFKVSSKFDRMRATLAETNRDIARNSRLIDDTPLGAELIQYEKRLDELHSQVWQREGIRTSHCSYFCFPSTYYYIICYAAIPFDCLTATFM